MKEGYGGLRDREVC